MIKRLAWCFGCVFAMAGAHAFAQSTTRAAPAAPATGAPAPVRIAPAAQPAVAVVGAFFEALAKGDLKTAGAQLDPGVVVVTNGGIRGGREDYMAHQAAGDSAFLKASQRHLVRRDAQADANVAWVVSEKRFAGPKGALETIETLVLAKRAGGWKIVHIHWSSRPGTGR